MTFSKKDTDQNRNSYPFLNVLEANSQKFLFVKITCKEHLPYLNGMFGMFSGLSYFRGVTEESSCYSLKKLSVYTLAVGS